MLRPASMAPTTSFRWAPTARKAAKAPTRTSPVGNDGDAGTLLPPIFGTRVIAQRSGGKRGVRAYARSHCIGNSSSERWAARPCRALLSRCIATGSGQQRGDVPHGSARAAVRERRRGACLFRARHRRTAGRCRCTVQHGHGERPRRSLRRGAEMVTTGARRRSGAYNDSSGNRQSMSLAWTRR